MHHFDRIDGALHAEAAPLEAIAEAVGTPVYVYSTATLTRHYGLFREAVEARSSLGDALIAFAVKANSNLSVLATLARLGCGADTVSEGEIRRALKAGVPGQRIVFSGVGKTDAELAFAIEAGVRQINVESAVELERLITVAAAKGAAPEIAIRVNPKIGAGGHARITTGGATDKFGVPAEEAPGLYARAAASPHVTPVGLACHIGSQITTLEPLEGAFRALREMTLALRADGLGVEAVFEPGRVLAANAGVLLSRVIQVNARSDGRTFLVLDAGMNDLMRPALYDAFHDVVAVRERAGEARAYDLVGPICESTDVFARERALPPLQAGDLVAFMGAGAYGAVLASEYNSRPLVPEVLVDGARWAVVRARPSYDEVWAREPKADWLG